MRKLILISFLCLMSTSATLFGQQKLAQAGMKFLLVSPDARMSAMGDANTAIESNSSSAIFLNPAGMARQQTFADVSVGQINWVADIKYLYGAASFAPSDGLYGVMGVSMLYVDYGQFYGTIRDASSLGYMETGVFSPKAYYIGVSYAKALNDKLSIGANIKYAVQDLKSTIVAYDDNGISKNSYKPSTVAFDFGILFHTGIKSLDFGVSIRNFSKELKLERENFQLPLVFKVGLAFNASDLLNLDKNEHSLQLAIDASHPRDNREQIDIGLEYKFMNMLALRVGNSSPNDEHNFTAGIGLQKNIAGLDLGVDYAYIPWSTFSDVHKFTVHFGL